MKAEAARVAELEALKERGPLTEEQEAELAELWPKVAQQKQKEKEKGTRRGTGARMAAAARVAVLEELKEQGPLTAEQETELAELQPKAQQKQKRRKDSWSGTGREGRCRPGCGVGGVEGAGAADCRAGDGARGAPAEGAAVAEKEGI
ncbi:hypothetical protein [Saccharopolyspora spinosa]|uniref:hypothetical protein n=1 Tax=Saccharopolyspora spinosa TaxID=60894 RepID=UPI00376F3F24